MLTFFVFSHTPIFRSVVLTNSQLLEKDESEFGFVHAFGFENKRGVAFIFREFVLGVSDGSPDIPVSRFFIFLPIGV